MYFYFKGRDFSVECHENGDIELHTTTIAFRSMMRSGFLESLMEIFKGEIWIYPED